MAAALALAATVGFAHAAANARSSTTGGVHVDQYGQAFPSLTFATSFAAAEIFLFLFAVTVLFLSLVMFVRLYPSLTPPTKTLTWVVAANLLLAMIFLLFSFNQLHYFVRGWYIADSDAFCHNVYSLARSCILFTWMGQPIMAWVTLRTITSRPVSDKSIYTLLIASAGVAFLMLLWNQATAPGVVIMGVFCGISPKFLPKPPSSIPPSSLPSPMDGLPLLLHELIGLATLLLSVYWYVKSGLNLRAYERERRRRRRRGRGKGRRRTGERERWWGNLWRRGREEKLENEVEEEVKEEQGREGGTGVRGVGDDLVLEEASNTPSILFPSSPSAPKEATLPLRGKEGEAREEEGEREEDLYSISAMQERTRAAQRAAVLMLLPIPTGELRRGREGRREEERNRPSEVTGNQGMEDVEAGEGEREGERGVEHVSTEGGKRELPRGWTVGWRGERDGGRDLMEEYLRRSQRAAEVEAARAWAFAWEERGGREGGRGREEEEQQQFERRATMSTGRRGAGAVEAAAAAAARDEDDKESEAVAQLLHAAGRTLVNRAWMLLNVYYLPFTLLHISLLALNSGPLPPAVAYSFLLAYSVGSPVLQAVVLVGVAVGIGRNIRKYGGMELGEEEEVGEKEEEGERRRMNAREGEEGKEEGEGDRRARMGLFMYEQGEVGRVGGGDEEEGGRGGARESGLSPTSSSSEDKGSGSSGGGGDSGVEDIAPPCQPRGGREVRTGRRRRSSNEWREAGGGRRGVSEPMQALSTIYEVAFKKKTKTNSSLGGGSGDVMEGGGGDGKRRDEEQARSSGAGGMGEKSEDKEGKNGGAAEELRGRGGGVEAGEKGKAARGMVLVDGVGREDALVPEALNLARQSVPPSRSKAGPGFTSRSRRSINTSPVPPSLPPSGLGTPLHPLTKASVRQLGSPYAFGRGGEGGREVGWPSNGLVSEISSLTDNLEYALDSGEAFTPGGARSVVSGRRRVGGSGSLLPSVGFGLGTWGGGRGGGFEEEHDHVLDRSDVYSEVREERDEREEEEGHEAEEGEGDGEEIDDDDDKLHGVGGLEAWRSLEEGGRGGVGGCELSEEWSGVSSTGRSIVTNSGWPSVVGRTMDKEKRLLEKG